MKSYIALCLAVLMVSSSASQAQATANFSYQRYPWLKLHNDSLKLLYYIQAPGIFGFEVCEKLVAKTGPGLPEKCRVLGWVQASSAKIDIFSRIVQEKFHSKLSTNSAAFGNVHLGVGGGLVVGVVGAQVFHARLSNPKTVWKASLWFILGSVMVGIGMAVVIGNTYDQKVSADLLREGKDVHVFIREWFTQNRQQNPLPDADIYFLGSLLFNALVNAIEQTLTDLNSA